MSGLVVVVVVVDYRTGTTPIGAHPVSHIPLTIGAGGSGGADPTDLLVMNTIILMTGPSLYP